MYFGNLIFLVRYVRLEIFMFMARVLIEGVDKEYLSCPLNFKTFGNMSQKLWPNIYFISQLKQSRQI